MMIRMAKTTLVPNTTHSYYYRCQLQRRASSWSVRDHMVHRLQGLRRNALRLPKALPPQKTEEARVNGNFFANDSQMHTRI